MNLEQTTTIPTAAQPTPLPRQRVRITFARDERVRYVGHLDMARTWERLIRRAGLPIAYSEGFNPHPRLAFAAALPVGCTSDDEMLDIIFSPPCDVADARARLDRAAPAGIRVTDAIEVAYSAPALQTQTRATEFVATLKDEASIERTRRDKTYDLRPLILAMWVEPGADGRVSVVMRLKAEESGTGRPDEVVAALGWDAGQVRIHRRKLILAELA